MTTFRELMLQRLREDLVGPIKPDEILDSRPTERYLTGILFPQGERLSPEEDESLPEGEDNDGPSDAGSAREGVSLGYTVRPASCALSFAVIAEGRPDLEIEVAGARYEPQWGEDERRYASNAKWQRAEQRATIVSPTVIESGLTQIPLADYGLAGLSLRIRWGRTSGESSILTVAVVNEAKVEHDKIENECNAFFQSEVRVRARGKTRLVARPSRRTGEGNDLKLLYRHALEYAVGHTCSADWSIEGNSVTEVRTTWVPSYVVPAVSPSGQPTCGPFRKTAFDPEWLAAASPHELKGELEKVAALYGDWLRSQSIEPAAPALLKKQADHHMKACFEAEGRMRGSIALLCDESLPAQKAALAAFRLAMKAMALQRMWATGSQLTWYPFQLGFQLVVLESLASPDHADRGLMDLLWFPTGGGKTEAYLGLIAFVVFHRRLRQSESPNRGAGTAAMMRYTLRLLTIQQFQRAARLICACECLRQQSPGTDLHLGDEPFSIGLWVGGGATPNTVADAEKTINADANPTARQLKDCPCCGRQLSWTISRAAPKQVRVRCQNRSGCSLAAINDGYLQIWTVDEDIYRRRPSLVIGTADKFTQIVRKPSDTIKLFGGRDENDPPDLILQDELHLISGPLGSLAGIYEMAIDELCTKRDQDGAIKHRAKIIGSTATIRAAGEQVSALFARDTRQFPPPELSAETGFFARRADEAERPGRLYVGITSAGRSPKFVLQALYASLLQSAAAIPVVDEKDRDPWWTLIGYFNSLRELGGSLVMLSDDVPVSIGTFARARGEESCLRVLGNIDELTSRKSQVDLRDTLRDLEQIAHPDPNAFDAVLATNMISVGVDVDRIGTMAVTNQPKQMAEYIQATSRIGRKHPGIVVTMYNNNRARDRSHYESFRSWHQALYRDVEATSVTPLAPRARDKALHAALVALAAARIQGLRTKPKLTAERRREIEADIVTRLVARAEIVDKSELPGVVQDLQRILDRWSKRLSEWEADNVDCEYWMDSSDERTLLMSAENVAGHMAGGRPLKDVMPTLNSLRNVEASSPFALAERIYLEQEARDAD